MTAVACPYCGGDPDACGHGGIALPAVHDTRPSWDSIFMSWAHALASRSTCSRLKVGSIIVAADNSRIFSFGYNGNYAGGPNKCDSDQAGHCGCLHAEINSLLKMDYSLHRVARIYVTDSPCVACAKAIVNAGIKEVAFDRLYRDSSGIDLLKRANIDVKRVEVGGG